MNLQLSNTGVRGSFRPSDERKEKDRTSVSDLIEKAILDRFSSPGDDPRASTVSPPAQSEPVPQGDNGLPDYHGKSITIEERRAIALEVDRRYPGRRNAQRRVDVMNNIGVLNVDGKVPEWTTTTLKFFMVNVKRKK